MKYEQFLEQTSFDLNNLIAFSYGQLIKCPPEHFDARLPAPPFLMIDRILSMGKSGNKGKIIAEQDIRPGDWYFQCHFVGDPVQPGCLGIDAVWQLLGFYCVWRGALGAGRALGCKEISFTGQIRPHNKLVRFEIDVLRFQEFKNAGSSIVIADATISVDNEAIASIKRAKTGVFKGIAYKDDPNYSPNSIGRVHQE